MPLTKNTTGLILIILCTLHSCSTQKNTRMSRFYHSTTTRYNIHYNGKNSYNSGIEKIQESNTDNFSEVLSIYPISNIENKTVASSEMNRTIEKCRKSIKLHSIKKKPQRNYKKLRDPEYLAFYEQNEFNNMLNKAWILLAKSEFHKGDFLESIGTFMYIAKHYQNNKDIVAQCQLWITRAYTELGWIYEAEDGLLKIKQDELKHENSQLYAIANAELLLKKEQYEDAIPFLQIAADNEKKKYQRTRLNFILGQLYEIARDTKMANDAYNKVIKSSPAFEMDFNAHIKQAQLSSNNEKALKSLKKMSTLYKFKDNLDQVFGAIGNIYLQQKDTANAIENYKLAITNSTKNGLEKADVLITLGDLYYTQSNYTEAQPCYSEASQIIPTTNDDYTRINTRAETLNELIVHQESFQLQDSLLHLSTLTKEEQLSIANQIIANLEEAERIANEKQKLAANNPQTDKLAGVNTQNMIGGNGNNKWYFYNTALIQSGKTEFNKKWGQRKLEDNWRRESKTINTTFTESNSENTSETDSSQTTSSEKKNNKDAAYYIQQIPTTKEQIEYAHNEIANALYNMGLVYKDKIKDITLAQKTFDELEKRYPDDKRMIDVYYIRHLIALQDNNTTDAEHFRRELLRKFPDSKQAQTLQYPDYAKRLLQMETKQDSVYQQTYKAYLNSDYNTVFSNKNIIEQNYPLSPLLPKFYFLNALSVAKTQDSKAFASELQVMINKYPNSDVSAMAKDMLALMNQGKESQKGKTHGSLIAKRNEDIKQEQTKELSEQKFSTDKKTTSACLMIIEENETKLNELMYKVALFNFSKFLIKDFDLSTMPLGNEKIALRISNFANYDETVWYQNLIQKDVELNLLLNKLGVKIVRISEENLKLLNTQFTVEEYELFQAKELQ